MYQFLTVERLGDVALVTLNRPERYYAWHAAMRSEVMYGAIRELDEPIVAALNGVAAGSAFQVALLCDVRVGHSESRMGQAEINAGIPSTLGPWLMQMSLGLSRTVELTLTGRMMDGDECYRIGLLHHLVPNEGVHHARTSDPRHRHRVQSAGDARLRGRGFRLRFGRVLRSGNLIFSSLLTVVVRRG